MKSVSVQIKSLHCRQIYKALFLIVMITIFLQGCTTTKKYNEVAEQRDRYELRNRYLLEHVKRLEVENEVLATRLVIEATGNAVINSIYDELVEELENEIISNEIVIEKMQSGVNVILAEKVLFSSGATELNKTGHEMLLEIGEELRETPFQTLVVGFTDNVPVGSNLAKSYPSNWELAGARAARVVRVLEESGVAKEQLRAVSLGENMPIASNDTSEGRAKNRRIEIRLRPIIVEK